MRRASIGIAAVMLAAAGCSLITSYDEFDRKSAGAAVCGRTVPAPPSAAAGGQGFELTGVTSDYSLGDTFDGGAPLGFNIDGVCTCTGGGPSSCALPAGSTNRCDDKSGLGIDNGASGLLAYLFGQANIGTEFSNLLHAGKHGFLVEVQEYNGTPDDANVTVAVFNVAGLVGRDTAAFDGNDVFLTDLNSTATAVGPGASVYFTTSAYVANGVLVALLPNLHINFLVTPVNELGTGHLGTRVELPFQNAVLVGPIAGTGPGLTMLHGQITGRIPQTDMLKQLQRIGVCAGSPSVAAKSVLCNALDITTAILDKPTAQPCDALSFVLGFSLLPAKRQTAPGPKLDPSPGPCPTDGPLTCP